MADPYLKSGRWPTWHFVRETMTRERLDADELIQSLPRVGPPPGQGTSYGLTWYNPPYYIQDDHRLGLNIAAAHHISDLIPVMVHPFLNVLRELVQMQRELPLSPDEVVRAKYTPVTIRGALPSISDLFMARLPDILDHEPATWGGSKWVGQDGAWTRELGRDISRYDDLLGLTSYVRRVTELMPEPANTVVQAARNGPVQHVHFPAPVVIRDLPRSVTGFNSDLEVAPAPESQVPPAPPAPVYVDESLIKELEDEQGTTQWDLGKLIQLIRELNSNFAVENPYASLALLRAILDHVPPVLGMPDFKQAASNYKWGQTDGGYARMLRDARALGDDALHRQIGRKPDLLSMDDVPSRRWLVKILRHVIDAL